MKTTATLYIYPGASPRLVLPWKTRVVRNTIRTAHESFAHGEVVEVRIAHKKTKTKTTP